MVNEILERELALHNKWIHGEEGGVRFGSQIPRNSSVSFTDAVLRGANLEGALLQWSIGKRTDFTKANLRSVDFSHSVYQKANFYGANLAGANFKDCNLPGADFRNTCLTGASFELASFRGAIFVDGWRVRDDVHHYIWASIGGIPCLAKSPKHICIAGIQLSFEAWLNSTGRNVWDRINLPTVTRASIRAWIKGVPESFEKLLS